MLGKSARFVFTLPNGVGYEFGTCSVLRDQGGTGIG